MITEKNASPIILVLEDVEETRDGIEKLLKVDGYRVDSARDEEDAVGRARRERPNLILVSLAGPEAHVIATVGRVRQRAGLSDNVPVVIFCTPTIPEGAEVEIGRAIHLTWPDNFDQLRAFLHRLIYLVPPKV